MTTTEDIISRAETLLAGITPGKWTVFIDPNNASIYAKGVGTICITYDENYDDMHFIAAAPELVRGLCEEVKRLRELVSTAYPFVLTHCAEWSYRHGLPDGEYHPTHKAIIDAAQKVFAEVNK